MKISQLLAAAALTQQRLLLLLNSMPNVCEIYTDVDGVYTADPRVVPNAHKMTEITYDEMLEMASLGAKVLHSRCVEIAKNTV